MGSWSILGYMHGSFCAPGAHSRITACGVRQRDIGARERDVRVPTCGSVTPPLTLRDALSGFESEKTACWTKCKRSLIVC